MKQVVFKNETESSINGNVLVMKDLILSFISQCFRCMPKIQHRLFTPHLVYKQDKQLLTIIFLSLSLFASAQPVMDSDNDKIPDATECPTIPCVDTDQDGVPDYLDHDSDNDGVLDIVDCGFTTCPEGPIVNGDFELPGNPDGGPYFISQSNVPGWKTTGAGGILEFWTGFDNVSGAYPGQQCVELNAYDNGALYQKLCLEPGTVITWKVKHRGRFNPEKDIAQVKIGSSLAAAQVVAQMESNKVLNHPTLTYIDYIAFCDQACGSKKRDCPECKEFLSNLQWNPYSGTYTVPAGQKDTYFVFSAVSSGNGDASYGNFIDDVEIEIVSTPQNAPSTCLDSDNDGLPNYRDLDADADGCPDAIEAYQSVMVTGTDGNQYYGNGSPPAVDGNGKVIDASYSAFDRTMFTASTATTITSQPTDKNMYSSTPVMFTVGTSEGGDTTKYQWQLSTDEGMTWSNVTDTMFYSGMKTKELKVKKAIAAMDGRQFRLKVIQTSRFCTELYSDTVKLNTCTLTATAGKISDQTCIPVPGEPSDGKAYVNASGGTLPYLYNWDTTPAKTTDTIEQLDPGSYQVTVTDVNGCSWTSNAITIASGTGPCCKNPTLGGNISIDQYICLQMQPAKLSSTAGASGETGVLQYKWQMSTQENPTNWTDIPGATSLDYQPPLLNQTTWYRRIVKVDCEETWDDAPASNVVKITVVPDTDRYLTIESLQQPTCNPPDGCKVTIRGLPTATWTIEQTGPVDKILTGNGNPLLINDLPDGVYKFRTADALGCIVSPPFGVIVVTY